jgi:dienelactone hydrolase
MKGTPRSYNESIIRRVAILTVTPLAVKGMRKIVRKLWTLCSVAGVRLIAGAGLICLAVAPGICQTKAPLSPGQIENVTCDSDPTQSYALYLPSTYSPSKRWPIIYFFDPGAHGGRPVELYKDVAEKYGFVIVGSNNSRNFSRDESKILNAIWNDTHQRLTLDERRIYTSGFSGGARLAGSMAVGCSPCQIAGVIANGAGYPNGKAEATEKLLYFFAIGNQDFNWPEVVKIRREREERSLPYRVREFSGSHQWAPSAVMEDAVEWLMVRAMQSGNLSQDTAFIERRFRQVQAEAEDAKMKNDPIAQLSAYRSMVSDFAGLDFAGLKDVTEAATGLAELKTSAALKTALKVEQDQIAEQFSLENEISPKLHAYVNGNSDDSIRLGHEVVQAMAGLRERAQHANSDGKRLVFSRAFDDIWVDGIETGQQQLESRHFEGAEACFRLMSQVKNDPWPLVLLADTHAAAGNRKLAIKDLQEATKRGLNDSEAIESDNRLQVLKTDADFQRIIDQLKHK